MKERQTIKIEDDGIYAERCFEYGKQRSFRYWE